MEFFVEPLGDVSIQSLRHALLKLR